MIRSPKQGELLTTVMHGIPSLMRLKTVDQMIEFGYIRPNRPERNRLRHLPPNVDEDELNERIAADIRARHLREVFFANRHPRREAILQLQDRVRTIYMVM